MSREKAIKVYTKNRNALEKIYKIKKVKDKSWLDLHNSKWEI